MSHLRGVFDAKATIETTCIEATPGAEPIVSNMPDSAYHWCWPLDPDVGVLQSSGPGSFGYPRRHDVHTGVDLHCPEGSDVHAVEPGIVVAVLPFTGPEAESPWWLPTTCVLVEGASGVICYGEIKPCGYIKPGASLDFRGEHVGQVQRVLRHDKGLPTTMLHFEFYEKSTTEPVWWKLNEPKPKGLLDPTYALIRAIGR